MSAPTLRLVKIGLAAALAAALLVVGGLAIFALSFDPNQYKQTIIDAVRERDHRTLGLPGALRMELYPPLTLRTGPITISERNHPDTLFASADDLLLHLDLFALLKWRLSVDRVLVVHPVVHVRRDAQGEFNFSDLLPKSQPDGGKGSPLRLSVHRVVVEQGTLTYDDDASHLHGRLDGLQIEAAGLAGGSDQPLHVAAMTRLDKPALNARIELRGKLTLDPDGSAGGLNDIALSVQGDVAGLKAVQAIAGGAVAWTDGPQGGTPRFEAEGLTVKGSAQAGARRADLQASLPSLAFGDDGVLSLGALQAKVAVGGAGPLRASLALPAMRGRPQALAPQTVTVTASGGPPAQPDWSLKLASPAVIDLSGQRFGLSDLKLTGEVKRLGGAALAKPQPVSLTGRFQAAPADPAALTWQIGGTLGASTAQWRGGWDHDTLRGTVSLDKFDTAAWTPPARTASASAPAAKAAAIDLSPLRAAGADLQIQVGQLAAGGTQWQAVQATIKSDRKTLAIAPFSANGYGGQIKGSLSVDLAANAYHLQQSAQNVAIQPLLQAATGRSLMSGTVNETADLRAGGVRLDALLRTLAGTVRIDARNGALSGVDLPAILRGGASLLAAKQDDTFTPTLQQATSFSTLGATFKLDKGVATNTDLKAQSPLLRIGGAGRFNLPAQTLQYTLVPALTGSLPGLSAQANAGLRGVEVPVQLRGQFAAPTAAVQWSEAGSRLLRKQIDQHVQDAVGRKLPDAAGALPKSLRQPLQKSLENLLH